MSAISVGELEATLKLRDLLTPALTAIDRELVAAGKSFKQVGSTISGLGSAMLPLSAGIGAVGFGATAMATDLNAAMANVASLMPGNIERVGEMKAAVQSMAIATGKSTGDLADGLYQVVSAFGDSAETARILETNARAAAAGVATTTDAINLTSAVTKGYGDTSAAAVERVADLALQTVKLGQTTFPELAASIGRVTPLTAELGVKQEELFGIMATFTGVTGGAAEVSTQLRGVLQGLMSPTDSMGELFEQLGVSSGKALIEQRGLQGAINAIVEAAKSGGGDLKDYLGSIEGQTLALSAAGAQSKTLTEKMLAMRDVAGVTDAAFREQTEGINAGGFAWAQFQQKMAVAAQKAGDVLLPVLLKVGQAFSPLLDGMLHAVAAFSSMPAPVQAVGVVFAGLVAAAGPVLMVVGSLIGAMGYLLTALGSTATVGSLAVGGLGLLLSPIALVVGAVAGLALAWWKWGDDVTRVASQAFAAVKAYLWDKLEPVLTPIGGLLRSIGAMFSAFGQLVGAVAALALDEVVKFVSGVADWLGAKLKPVIEPAVALFRSIATVMGEVAAKSVASAQQLYEGAKGWLLDKFSAVVASVKAKIDAVTEAFRVMYDKVVGNSYVPDMVDGVAAEFERLKTIMVGVTTTATTAVSEKFAALAADVPLQLQGLSETIGTVFNQDLKATFDQFASGPLGELFTKIDDHFGGKLSAAVTKGVDVFQNGMRSFQGFARVMAGDFSGIGDAAIGAWNVVASIGPQIAGVFRSLFGGPSAQELAGREIVANFEQNIQSMLSDVQRLEAGNESWRRTVVVVRDAYMAMGRSEAEALAAVEALWKSSKGGADEVERAMRPIEEALAFIEQQASETGLSFEELRARGIAMTTATTSEVDGLSDALAAVVGQINQIPNSKTFTVAAQYYDPGPPAGFGDPGGSGTGLTGGPPPASDYSGYYDFNGDGRDQNGYATGTKGETGSWFADFGAGTPTVLHGREAVVREDQTDAFVAAHSARTSSRTDSRLESIERLLRDMPRAMAIAVDDAMQVSR